ncbi:MAG TPA: pitrilysin family protein [Bryobacteraceae bacterium]|nr:pitrilysin family protein [Bryobacteraceae bacterium]
MIREVESTTMPNGIRVATEAMPHVRSVSVGVWIGSGARRETASENGISHFIEHMVFKGTAHRSAEEIARIVDSWGGHLDAYTAKELVSFNAKVLDEQLSDALELLADLVLHPRFDPEDIEKEKGVILEELKMDVDNPEYLVHETFSRHFWKNHPLGRSIIGTKSTIRSFTRPMVEAYYQRVYEPRNIVITAAGRVEHARMVELVEKHFGGLRKRDVSDQEPTPRAHAPLILKNKRSLEQVHLCMGVPAYPLTDPRRYACYILSTTLGGGMSSRLFQNIREKHGLAYSVFSELQLYRDTGCLAVYAGTSLETAPQVIQMTMDEFRRLAGELIPDDELRRAKDHLKGSLALSLESTSSRMSNIARQELFFRRFFTFDEMVASINAVTPEQVREVAQDFFSGRQVGATVLGRLDGFNLSQQQLVC